VFSSKLCGARLLLLFFPILIIFLAFGISFQLPIVMYAISSLGLVDTQYWKDKFKYAVLIMIIFGALVTPDGSGITMWFIVLPMLLLYISGTYIIVQKEHI
jgi:sec-independent protein translocase protein TatC